jgi:hypothetical protein
MAKNARPALTPARRNARIRTIRIRRRVLLGGVLVVAAYLTIFFVNLIFTSMTLDRREKSVRKENERLTQQKKIYREKIKNSSSLEGQKDQMRETGRFEDNEVPFVILEPGNNTPGAAEQPQQQP